LVLPDEPTARGAATSWRVYLVSLVRTIVVLPLVGKLCPDQREDVCSSFFLNKLERRANARATRRGPVRQDKVFNGIQSLAKTGGCDGMHSYGPDSEGEAVG
jgi:hypothetical protein